MMDEAHLQAACCDLAADVARTHGKVQLKVAGASMVPALWPGDLVTVRGCDPGELHPDQIIVFRQKERLVVHRLVRWVDSTRWAGDCAVTRGDARPRCDEPVKASEVIGRVEGILRNGRPVNPEQSIGQRMTAAILRRSEWCTRLFLRLGSRMRRLTAISEPV
jgi:signal peptidase I